MTEPSIKNGPKPASYLVIILIAWAIVGFLIGMAIWSLVHGDITDFIVFLVFAACFLIAIFLPKWFRRFANWYTGVRGR